VQRRKVAWMRALYKAYNGERACKDTGVMLQMPHYLSRDDHHWKIRARKQRTDVGKFSFVIRTSDILDMQYSVVLRCSSHIK
jgi:hypothetical protein